MATVEIYMRHTCPYCRRALALLEEKKAEPQIIDITEEPERREEMIQRAGGRTTVPQIFIDGQHIGGCDDLMALNSRDGLDPLLVS
ncbi:glutaredoxin 3 [Phaeovibrio sulfidiphilus]|uniref:Glutaredoxin n=1 Tax=Phaeovibrio sulfidiphilus TaxID=1220600 RepID=A0A8J7CDV2_9PROT|nr:glutaredoxin 3 [Phaeovibrio sulfidiphilus]MBE1237294.1 glutaredoxin 3 [Phaeovibrio sulfidiphilus]